MKDLKFLSSNIRYENPKDGPQDWPFRADFLCSLINNHTPTVLGSQEGRQPQLLDFESRLKNLQIIQSHRPWIAERMYPCLYINHNEIIVIESGDKWLSQTPDVPGSKSFGSSFPRLCTWAHLKFKSGLELIVANTHLDHILQETRIKQSEVLINELLEIKNRLKLDIVLMGDFNESPNYSIKQNICERLGLIDPWEKLALAEEPSHHSFLGFEQPGLRIDWILVPDHFEIESIKLLKDKSPTGIYPSDHYPLILSCNTHP